MTCEHTLEEPFNCLFSKQFHLSFDVPIIFLKDKRFYTMIVLFSKHYLLKTSSTLSLKILILSQYGKIELKYFLRLGRKLARHAIQLWVIQTVVRKPNLVLILKINTRANEEINSWRWRFPNGELRKNSPLQCVIKKVALSRSEMISFSVNIFVLLFVFYFSNPLAR